MNRPSMLGGTEEETRSSHQAARWLVLEESHREIVEEWRDEFVNAEQSDAWGPTDLSVNPLMEVSTQLSTPGLYGTSPVLHNAADGSQIVSMLDGMGYWTKMQRVEFYTRGVSDCVVKLEVASDPAEVVPRIIRPSDIYAVADRQRPDVPIRVSELRVMYWEAKEKSVYVWETYSIAGDEPYHRINLAKNIVTGQGLESELGEDVSEVFLDRGDGTTGALVGDEYPHRYEDGTPFLPFVFYRLVDSGKLWNWTTNRGAYHGTLNAEVYATFAGHCARAASGSFVMAAGLVPQVSHVGTPTDGTTRLKSAAINPGTILYHETDGDSQPFVTEVGPGGNLKDVADFAANYTMQIAIRMGLNPADVQRQHANPTSGAALYISNKAKREMAQRIEPLFRRVDLEAIRKIAAIARVFGIAEGPETGWSITYHHPPDSPEEEKDRREDIQWRLDRGMIGPIEAYQELHPGVTREAAIDAIMQARQDAAMLDARAKQIESPAPPVAGAQE